MFDLWKITDTPLFSYKKVKVCKIFSILLDKTRKKGPQTDHYVWCKYRHIFVKDFYGLKYFKYLIQFWHLDQLSYKSHLDLVTNYWTPQIITN